MDREPPATSREILPTRRSLLSRLKRLDDDASWQEFHQLYHRLIFSFARRKGLTETEAQDAVQDTLVAVARTMPSFQYDPARCSFKAWLRHLAEKRIIDLIRRRQRAGPSPAAPAGTELEDLLAAQPDPGVPSPDAVWDEEWRRQILETAIERVKAKANPRQFRVFHSLVVQEIPAKEVRDMFEMSLAAIYVARHRIAAAVRHEARRLEKELSARGRAG